MSKLSEELASYIQDPRFLQALALVAPSRPSPSKLNLDDDPQKSNNLAFMEKGWLKYDEKIRGLLTEEAPKETEPPITYGEEE